MWLFNGNPGNADVALNGRGAGDGVVGATTDTIGPSILGRGGETGRRTGLKILGPGRVVRVRFPPPAPIPSEIALWHKVLADGLTCAIDD